jgi:hypothetical protein
VIKFSTQIQNPIAPTTNFNPRIEQKLHFQLNSNVLRVITTGTITHLYPMINKEELVPPLIKIKAKYS